MTECRHSHRTDEPNGWTVCVDCEANIERWASKSVFDRREHKGLELKAYKGRLVHVRETRSFRDVD